jgi:hypothetical protein
MDDFCHRGFLGLSWYVNNPWLQRHR